jgi:hypothetical protein
VIVILANDGYNRDLSLNSEMESPLLKRQQNRIGS